MKNRQALFVLVWGLSVSPATPGAAQNAALLTDVKAPRILMVEAATGTVLLSRNPDEPFAPGSLAKLMTVETVADALTRGEIQPDTTFRVSEHAWRSGGAPSRTTTMFAALGTNISVLNLLTGAIVQNANDACIVLAEGLSDTEDAFAQRMNERAAVLGLSGSRFGNATGLPSAENRMTVRDALTLAQRIQSSYPDFFALYGQVDFEWNRIRQRNKNPLFGSVAGVDGFAAGYADGAGFGLVATAMRGETRLFLAMSGLASERERLEEASRLIDWGFDGFVSMRAYAAGDIAGEAEVYGGDAAKVALAPLGDIHVYAPTAETGRLSAEIEYRGPIRAPVEKGREIGLLKVKVGETVLQEAPVYTAESVEQGSLASRAGAALWALVFFWR
ncbi:D-alanyl-D-alanine carboxypeptidase [Rhizobiaceae bacterium BDR2-2]|uniref:serine-type D-Ala-D-Ala carboxypeptidase n=1 Tax=Ectorhizobium quercum TaxID=2965071 RepID=A0AAE3MZ13_9HYPH|nr:D-alanyl-D-alanine carboxypeptidase family protein [Ectorhizobium quercum]MCX8997663.1 D-alanyl-D-alanine carboxypeptidase [Ectorhizobium quercum]